MTPTEYLNLVLQGEKFTIKEAEANEAELQRLTQRLRAADPQETALRAFSDLFKAVLG